jgi:acyl-CoA synthetase
MSKRELRQRRSADGAHRPRTLPDAILAAATARPDLPTIFCSAARSESVSLADLVDRAARGAAAFRGLGVQPGDSVAVQVPSRIEGVVVQAAAVLAGAVPVPVVPSYGPRELGFIVRESRARLLVTPDRLGRRDYLVDLQRIGDCPDLSSVAVIADSVPHGYLDWAQLVNSSEPLCTPTASAPDDVCLLSYTSGTTGQPKGVQHTHTTLLAELRTRLTGVADDSVILAAFPYLGRPPARCARTNSENASTPGDRLQFGELLDPVVAPFPADPALLESAKDAGNAHTVGLLG